MPGESPRFFLFLVELGHLTFEGFSSIFGVIRSNHRSKEETAMAEELPDWLAEMRDQQLGDQLEQTEPEPGSKRETAAALIEDLGGQTAPPAEEYREPLEPLEQAGEGDVLEGLREQMVQAEEEFEDEDDGSPLARIFSGLEPRQRLLLAVLFFLDVALCGCMALVMAGRVMLPF
ncbi:MAG: hypothetical protein B6I35_01415 [Anaerolineaceae bacterium 4572_32.2]|nr:MAG: hypothetical protein B6I35_01415 [Anaerolineaceae bacterium 4572_32.2]